MVADLIVAILIGIGIFYGYKKGLLIELITLLAFVIGIVSAFKLLHTTLAHLSPYVGKGSLGVLLAFILVFTAVFVLIFILGTALKKSLTYTIFGSFDNIAGALMGGLKAAFSISLILWLCKHAGADKFYHEYTQGAYIFPYMEDFAPEFIAWVSYVIPFKNIFPAIRNLLE